MGFNDYILTCEKENKELEKDLEYYKNQNIRLKTENKKYKEAIDKINKKCKLGKEKYDYDVWLKLNESWKTLDHFAEKIKYNLHPIITEAYQCDIKNSINEIIETTKYDVVFKEDILDILKEVSK